jgi:hypothetical protein
MVEPVLLVDPVLIVELVLFVEPVDPLVEPVLPDCAFIAIEATRQPINNTVFFMFL